MSKMKSPREDDTFIAWVARLAIDLSAAMIVICMLLVAASTVGRKFFSYPMAYSAELSEYMLLYVTMLGAAYLHLKGKHVRLDIAEAFLSARSLRILDRIADVFVLIVCLLLVYGSATVTIGYFRSGSHIISILSPPSWVISVVIPLGMFGVAAVVAQRFLRPLQGGDEDQSGVNIPGSE